MNINEIAKLAGVSRATVSRYLNNGYVSEEKRNIIRKVIEETGYQPSSQAQMLRTKKTKFVGVILPKIDSETISREVAGISEVLKARGYQMILANADNDVEEELKYLSLFKDNQVDGVIYLVTIFTSRHKKALKECNVPVVILGQHLAGHPCIFQDDYHAALYMGRLLAETGRRFGYITVTDKDESVGQRRLDGFRDALLESGIKLPEERVKAGSYTMESGYQAAKELFEGNFGIDTLLCATDTMAVGAMTYLKEVGYRIPQDVQVAGIGDGTMGKFVEPKLTTVHFHYKTSGMEAAEVLLALIEAEGAISKEIKMGCEVVLRESHRGKIAFTKG